MWMCEPASMAQAQSRRGEILFESVGGQILECLWLPPSRPDAPTLVFLHDGLGSLALWRDFPHKLAEAAGCAALVYSRLGNGWSSAREAPFAPDYMHRAALESLPQLLDQRGIEEPVLVGHSDGASIAAIHTGAGVRPVRALILEAPHVFVEDMTLTAVSAMREAFLTTDLPVRLSRYHMSSEMAFFGWNDIWLDPGFRDWNIENCLSTIHCPVLVIQGKDDEYGSLAQVESLSRGVGGRCETLILSGCGHTPHRERAMETLNAMRAFIATL